MIPGQWSPARHRLPEEGDGLKAADLPALRREIFVELLALARNEHCPATEWDAFVEAAWTEVGLAFGFVEREPWPKGLERPRLGGGETAAPQGDDVSGS